MSGFKPTGNPSNASPEPPIYAPVHALTQPLDTMPPPFGDEKPVTTPQLSFMRRLLHLLDLAAPH